MKKPTKWNDPKTAPKDGTMILGDFGFPWPLVAAWNEHDEKWVTASLQAQTMDGGKTDLWFENEQESCASLRGWLPFPKIPQK